MTPLEQMIADHRGMLADELHFPPSQSRPPVAFTWDDRERALVPDDRPLVINPLSSKEVVVPDSATQSTAVGMPMSARMLRYLTGPSPDTPWSAGLKALRFHCRKHHPFHRAGDRPYWRGSLCWSFVQLVVVREFSVYSAAQVLRYHDPETVLASSLKWITDHMDRAKEKQEKKAKEDRGLYLLCRCRHDWVHHDRPAQRFACGACDCSRYEAEEPAKVDHDPMSDQHVAECPNPVCRARRAA